MRYLFIAVCLLGGFMQSTANSFIVSGVIQAASGGPVAYATVAEKGTMNAVQSNANGAYVITVSNSNAELVISAIGYTQQLVKVKNQNIINIQLVMSNVQLNEVVVARGIATRKQTLALGYPSVQSHVPGLNVYGYTTANSDSFNTEEYDGIQENAFKAVSQNPLSTFSIDVDAAAYSNVRRIINSGRLPDAGAVRIEEMINYFKYHYTAPKGNDPFSIYTEATVCPWNTNHQIVAIGMQGRRIPVDNLPASNLVFLVDVSGSMTAPNRLPLVQRSLKLLVEQLREKDRISIVVYAGAAGVALKATSGANKMKIKEAIDNLHAGGSTAGGEGIALAYKIARENFSAKANNRIILCTDGDFNVGISSNSALEQMVENEREHGIYLTVLGYGMGNYKDNKLQLLADKGNGNHAYIDTEAEAKKVLINEFGGTLFTIAGDVKMQLEFNPLFVQAYRLIGYENRMLHQEDFNDDKKDAGELGSGHTVTALYEIIPVGVKTDLIKSVDPLKYQGEKTLKNRQGSNEMVTIKFRYKAPGSNTSQLMEQVIDNTVKAFDAASENTRFALAVAEFGLLLRNSSFKNTASYQQVIAIAGNALTADKEGYRKEFIELVKKAQQLADGKKDITQQNND